MTPLLGLGGLGSFQREAGHTTPMPPGSAPKEPQVKIFVL